MFLTGLLETFIYVVYGNAASRLFFMFSLLSQELLTGTFRYSIRGGPCRIRNSTPSLLTLPHRASIHQVAPVSAQDRTIVAACSRSSPGVSSYIIISCNFQHY